MKLVVNKSTREVTIVHPCTYHTYDQDLFIRIQFREADQYVDPVSQVPPIGNVLQAKGFKVATPGSTPFSPREVTLTLKQFYYSEPVFVKRFTSLPTSFTLTSEYTEGVNGEIDLNSPIVGARNAFPYFRDFGLRMYVSLMNEAFRAAALDNAGENGSTFSLLGEISWVTGNPHYPYLGGETIVTRSNTFEVPFTTTPLEPWLTEAS